MNGYAKFLLSNDIRKLVKSSELGYNGFIDFIHGDKVICFISNFFRFFVLVNLNEIIHKNYFLPDFNILNVY